MERLSEAFQPSLIQRLRFALNLQVKHRLLGKFVDARTESRLMHLGTVRALIASMESVQYVDQFMGGAAAVNDRRVLLELALKHVAKDGLYLEFGVYGAATLNFIARRTTSTVHGFDSFRGLPEDFIEGFPKGRYDTGGHTPPVRENVELHVGWFDETLPAFVRSHPGPVAFLHVDCDLYSSARTIFSCLGDRITAGCVIVFDEYFNYPGWQQNEYRAFQEFVRGHHLKYRYLAYNESQNDVGVIIE